MIQSKGKRYWDRNPIHDLLKTNFFPPQFTYGKYWSMTLIGWKMVDLDSQFPTLGSWTLNLAEEWAVSWSWIAVKPKSCVGAPVWGERITWKQWKVPDVSNASAQRKGREGTILGEIKKDDWLCLSEWQVPKRSTPNPCSRLWSNIQWSRIQSPV